MTDLERYEYQLNAVDSLVGFHPEFLDIFTPKERALFETYYLPDWDKVDDFRVYYKDLLRKNPAILYKVRPLMSKFVAAHGITEGERLLP